VEFGNLFSEERFRHAVLLHWPALALQLFGVPAKIAASVPFILELEGIGRVSW
jgi:hypothetical protein